MAIAKKRDLWYNDSGIDANCLRASYINQINNKNKMETQQLSFKWDKKLLTKITMAGTGFALASWLIVNLILGMSADWQQKYDANKVEGCIIEREWCKDKLTKPDENTVDDLKRCAEKAKWTCDFQ